MSEAQEIVTEHWRVGGEHDPVTSLAAISSGLSGLRRAAARHVAAVALRHRRCGTGGDSLDRPSPRGGAELVAGAAGGTDGYGDSPYQSLSSFAGNGLLMSPDWLIEDGLLRVSDCERRSFSCRRGRLRRRHSCSSAGCSIRPGPTSMPARVRICGPPMRAILPGPCRLAGGLRAVSRAEGEVRRGALPRVAGRAGPSRAGRAGPGPARVGEPDRSGPLCPVPALSPGRRA